MSKGKNFGRISTSIAEPLFSALSDIARSDGVTTSTLVKRIVFMFLATTLGEDRFRELFKKSYIDRLCVNKRELDYLMQPFFTREEIEKALPAICIKHLNSDSVTLGWYKDLKKCKEEKDVQR